MRKQTDSRTPKHNQARSSKQAGLIVTHQNDRRSVAAKPTLDNRSHRTSRLFTTCRSRAQHGAGMSAPFHIYTFHGLRGKRATARAA